MQPPGQVAEPIPLFSPDEQVFTVAELAAELRELVEESFESIWVEGEISNFKRPASGHCYFTLKDSDAQLRCVMWRSTAAALRFRPEDGMLVRVRARVSVYEARGDLQLVTLAMRPAGDGGLQAAFEAMKRRLAAEGLFDTGRKRALPVFPAVVGVVTSGSGAALQDVLSVLARRCPLLKVVICPVQVQGMGAAEEIAGAVAAFNRLPIGDAQRPDVLIVGRGGGSIEDLWAFNEEVVARAVFASGIPVVSAVGHETDFSIADFVADVRAATPSMAAEIVAPDCRNLEEALLRAQDKLRLATVARTRALRQQIAALVDSHRFQSPRQRILHAGQRLDHLIERMDACVNRRLERDRQRLASLQGRLADLHPLRPLTLGFAHVTRAGRTITDAARLNPGESIALRFRDGGVTATVDEIRPDDEKD
jgi:exodeoxyribonuclease VII large subunit